MLTISGSTSPANYQLALNSVFFESLSACFGPRTIEVSVVSDTAPTVSNLAVAIITSQGDHDGDGVADNKDVDDDNDGIVDQTEDQIQPGQRRRLHRPQRLQRRFNRGGPPWSTGAALACRS